MASGLCPRHGRILAARADAVNAGFGAAAWRRSVASLAYRVEGSPLAALPSSQHYHSQTANPSEHLSVATSMAPSGQLRSQAWPGRLKASATEHDPSSKGWSPGPVRAKASAPVRLSPFDQVSGSRSACVSWA